jgi:8-oxo-dGTP pyrophosphatase MutT (NUDIX family)
MPRNPDGAARAADALAAGAWVFPGGRVDEADGTLAAQMGRPGDPDATARITAIRETLEETGLLLGLDRQISAAAAAKARQALHAGATLGQVLQANAWRLDLALHAFCALAPATCRRI